MRRRGRLAGTHAVSHDECARWRIVTSYMRGRLAPRPQEELALLMRRCGIRPRLRAAPPAAGARGCHCFSPHACFADARPDTVGSGRGGGGGGVAAGLVIAARPCGHWAVARWPPSRPALRGPPPKAPGHRGRTAASPRAGAAPVFASSWMPSAHPSRHQALAVGSEPTRSDLQ